MYAFAALLWSAFTVARAAVRANFHSASFTGVTGVAFASSVFHATSMETTHIFAPWGCAINAREHFATLASTIVTLTLSILGFRVTVVFAGFFYTSNTSKFLSVERWVHVHQIAHTCRVDAYAVSVTVVWAIFLRAITAAISWITFAFSVVHAATMEATFFVACSYSTIRSGPALLTLARAFHAGAFGAAIIRTTLGRTVITSPHLPFKCSN